MVVLHLVEADDAGLGAALRTEGLPAPGAGHYFSASENGALAGYVGLEGEGGDQLLRSLVVLADRKARGLGSRMLAAVETVARDLGGHAFICSRRRPSPSSPAAASWPLTAGPRPSRSGRPVSSRTSARRRPPI
jgi:GNAT superfamily N-acetyltransferase